MNNETFCDNCIADVLRKIVAIQQSGCNNDRFSGCDKPFLGPINNTECYNTRPITLYNCCTGTPWSFEVTGTTDTSTIFRVESVDECCCTCRLLVAGTEADQYTTTNQFVTINLDCVGALSCLNDTYVDLC